MKKLCRPLWLLIYLFGFFVLILYRQKVSESVYSALSYSLFSLIPSLFPFTFLASLFSLSGASQILSRLISPVLRRVFKLRSELSAAFLSALCFGYPLGAKLSAELVREGKISKKEAGRFFTCTLNPGIPFTVLFVGGVLLDNMLLGLYIYLAVTLSDLMLLFLTGLGLKIPEKETAERASQPFSQNLKAAMDSSVKAMLNMAVYVIIFRALTAILWESGALSAVSEALFFVPSFIKGGIFCFFFEVTSGISDCISLRLGADMLAAGLAFGGLCMIFQLFSFFKDTPVKLRYVLFIRASAAAVTYFIMKLFYRSAKEVLEVFGEFILPAKPEMQGNFLTVFLILALFYTYLLFTEKKQNSRKL